MSATIVRIVIPLMAALGSFLGTLFGLAKLLPERAHIITDYQLKQIEALQSQNAEQAARMERLEAERRTQAHSIGNLEQEVLALEKRGVGTCHESLRSSGMSR
jgi:hypothetical protein